MKGKMIVCLTIQSQKISLKSSLISIILRLHCFEFLIIYYSHQSVAMWLTYCFLIILVAFDTINHDILLIQPHLSFSFGPEIIQCLCPSLSTESQFLLKTSSVRWYLLEKTIKYSPPTCRQEFGLDPCFFPGAAQISGSNKAITFQAFFNLASV